MNRALIHTLVPIVVATLLNLYIYTNRWNDTSRKQENSKDTNMLPPGYAIAIIWVIILGLLGYTHSITYPSVASYIIVCAIIYCLAYPFLTNGLQGDNAKLLNFLSFVIALVVLISVGIQCRNKTIIFTLPFVLWTLYVNIFTSWYPNFAKNK